MHLYSNQIAQILGKKILAIKTWIPDGRVRKSKNIHAEIQYILFDDEETYIELEDQDAYDFHDFDTAAKCLNVYVNKILWTEIMNGEKYINSNYWT